MLILVILVPAVAMATLAVVLRRRLAGLSLMTWLGWLLVGAGLPVLAGQLLSLSFSGAVEAEIARCETAGGADCGDPAVLLIFPLVGGLSGALGWIAGAITARLGGGRNEQ
ncbi:hypothetical protein DDZ18_01325 [Marinicauda salina]|uniref:Uncharacterized protein n=1 Tax=Marinicauda salina TaxID=2135793 RepID=A0A2U2BWA4_9PROT|nr:hypothetical protein [Marinicauda salina]PWE18277.1 hypothetical protein DDZ18_01325 [Marinicauda salina]